ncbi:GNAT family N-acetyltransferase [Falsibacillus pallidus]|uniref:GNAT family N-acetyltransferase n=1 Tax=Falsibacillus pallidus TaxID=493781 RepID=UPI003D97D15E
MVLIRDAQETELELIRKQRLEAYDEHKNKISANHWKGLRTAISSKADQENGAMIFVAELEGEIVGSIVLCPEKTDAYRGLVDSSEHPEIRMLAVNPHARGKGIAPLLINECLRRSKARGCTHIGLHTAPFMETAMKLYQKLGFQHVPEHDFEPADDGVVVKAFRKVL